MRKVSLFIVMFMVSAGLAHAQCTSALSADGSVFNAAFVPPAATGGFATATLNLNGTNATVNATTIGMGDVASLVLLRGSTNVATFTDQANFFHNGSFTRTVALDPELAAQIAANPSAFSFALDSGRGGRVSMPLTASTRPVLSGILSGPNGSGNFLLSFGQPINEFGDVPVTFDIVSSGAGNDISTLQLVSPAATDPLFTLGHDLTATNGRVVGKTVMSGAFVQQLLGNPCGIALNVNTPAGMALSGTLSAGEEVFIPVAGSTPGLLGNRWKTDLNLFNGGAPGNGNMSALVQFIPTGGSLDSALSMSTVSLPPRGGAATRDVTSAMFNGITGIGALRIVSNGSVFANARVYDDQTANGKGTLGQSVPGLMRSQALRSGALVGLTDIHSVSGANAVGAQNARTNVGFFNPNDTPTTLAVELRDGNGAVVGTRVLTLGPFMHTQMALAGANGLFTGETSDFAGRSVTFLASAPLFAYASIVDNDSGDASFVLPSSLE